MHQVPPHASEHLIRLRGGWELHDPGASTSGWSSLTLPIAWEPRSGSRRLRLVRKFGRPSASRVRLVLEAVEGLYAITLNGEPLAFDAASPARIVVENPPLLDRNVLALDVAFEGPSDEPTTPWGNVALAVSE
jgi:hypothetical protein